VNKKKKKKTEKKKNIKMAANNSAIHYVKWNQYLSNARVMDVLQKETPIKSVKSGETALNVLKFLLKHKFSSAPVWDDDKKEFVGSVSLLDCVIVLTGTAAGLGFIDRERPLGQVRADEICDLSFRNPWRQLSDEAAVIVALDVMASQHIHRIAITRSGGNQSGIVGYLTETTMARWVFEKAKAKLPAEALHVKVRDFHRTPLKQVKTVAVDQALRAAFDQLWLERISAVAVVDASGAVVGTVSASDLKYLDVNDIDSVHEQLKKPIADMLKLKDEAKTERAFFWANLSQVTASLDDTIEQLLEKLQAHRVHRLWLADADSKPIGVISLCDLIGELERADGKVMC
jgi:CBS-domain-containing membrane protein